MKSVFRGWSDVRVFLAVVRAGSTLAAAKTLGLSQPTVARRIDVLEHALGLRLFKRDTQGFHATSDGRALMPDAEAMENAADDFANRAASLFAQTKRTIRLTSFRDAFTVRLTTVLQDYTSRYPDVTFELLPSDDRLDLVAGEADVSIRVTYLPCDPALVCHRIRVVGMSLYASAAYASRGPLPVSADDLAGHRFVANKDTIGRVPSDIWLRERIGPEQVIAECQNYRSLEAGVLMGTGIGILASRFERENPTVVRCFDLPREVCPTSWLVISPTAWHRPEVKSFAAFFVPRYRALFETDEAVP